MTPDLLGQMSRAVREDVLLDPRWEDFARGALDETQRDDLLARARAAGMAEETIEALGPRRPSFEDRLTEAALAALAGATPEPARGPVAKAVSIRSRRLWLVAGTLGLAAGAAALVRWGSPPESRQGSGDPSRDLPVFSK